MGAEPDNSQINSDLALDYNDLAVSLDQKGDVKKQVELLNKAFKLAPDNKTIMENLKRAKQKESTTPKGDARPGGKKAKEG